MRDLSEEKAVVISSCVMLAIIVAALTWKHTLWLAAIAASLQ